MSLADIVSGEDKQYLADPSNHHPIIRHLAEHKNESGTPGGWNEWAVSCICGRLHKTTVPGRWFIPSKASCERIYKNHLVECGVLPRDGVASDDDEQPDTPDYEEIERTVAEMLATIIQALVSGLDDKTQAFTIVKKVLFALEEME